MGWDRFVPPHQAGSSSWQPAESEQWRPGGVSSGTHTPVGDMPEDSTFDSRRSSTSGPPIGVSRRSFSGRRNYDRRLGEIDTQLGNLVIDHQEFRSEYQQHVEAQAAWQQQADQRLIDIHNAVLQRQEEERAYWAWRGYNPHQQQ